MTWTVNSDYESLLLEKKSEKLYIFDLDGTIVTTASGRPAYRPKDEFDYVFLGPVDRKLSRLDGDILIVTNQTRLSEERRQRIKNILNELPKVSIFILKSEEWKKPSTKCLENLNYSEYFMCGDAAKGFETVYPPNLWSDSDYQFYLNIDGVKSFETPDRMFGHNDVPKKSLVPEVIILMGSPGSGKSDIAHRYVDMDYEIVSNDLKTSKSKIESIFNQKINVVIDNTHPSIESRAKWIDLANRYEYKKIKIIWCIRDGRPFNALREKPVPEIAYNIYSKHFEPPSEEEGAMVFIKY